MSQPQREKDEKPRKRPRCFETVWLRAAGTFDEVATVADHRRYDKIVLSCRYCRAFARGICFACKRDWNSSARGLRPPFCNFSREKVASGGFRELEL
jgi:hypothetical protein